MRHFNRQHCGSALLFGAFCVYLDSCCQSCRFLVSSSALLRLRTDLHHQHSHLAVVIMFSTLHYWIDFHPQCCCRAFIMLLSILYFIATGVPRDDYQCDTAMIMLDSIFVAAFPLITASMHSHAQHCWAAQGDSYTPVLL